MRAPLLVLAVATLGGCDRSDGRGPAIDATLVIDGAAPVDLPCVAKGTKPTREEVELLIARAVDVAGGAERLRKLRSKRVEELWLAQTGTLDGNRVVSTTWVRPDESVRVELRYRAGESEGRAMFQREEYLRPRAGEWELAAGASQQHVEWDWEVARLPVNLLDAEQLDPLPLRVEPGRTLVGAKVQLPGLNPPFEVWIDPRGPVVAEVHTRLPLTANLGANSWADHRQKFSDFRRVAGVLLPFRREIVVEGQRAGIGEAQTIDVDVELPDAVMRPK